MDPLEPTSSLLCDNNNIGLLLNVDWFKPFKTLSIRFLPS